MPLVHARLRQDRADRQAVRRQLLHGRGDARVIALVRLRDRRAHEVHVPLRDGIRVDAAAHGKDRHAVHARVHRRQAEAHKVREGRVAELVLQLLLLDHDEAGQRRGVVVALGADVAHVVRDRLRVRVGAQHVRQLALLERPQHPERVRVLVLAGEDALGARRAAVERDDALRHLEQVAEVGVHDALRVRRDLVVELLRQLLRDRDAGRLQQRPHVRVDGDDARAPRDVVRLVLAHVRGLLQVKADVPHDRRVEHQVRAERRPQAAERLDVAREAERVERPLVEDRVLHLDGDVHTIHPDDAAHADEVVLDVLDLLAEDELQILLVALRVVHLDLGDVRGGQVPVELAQRRRRRFRQRQQRHVHDRVVLVVRVRVHPLLAEQAEVELRVRHHLVVEQRVVLNGHRERLAERNEVRLDEVERLHRRGRAVLERHAADVAARERGHLDDLAVLLVRGDDDEDAEALDDLADVVLGQRRQLVLRVRRARAADVDHLPGVEVVRRPHGGVAGRACAARVVAPLLLDVRDDLEVRLAERVVADFGHVRVGGPRAAAAVQNDGVVQPHADSPAAEPLARVLLVRNKHAGEDGPGHVVPRLVHTDVHGAAVKLQTLAVHRTHILIFTFRHPLIDENINY